MRTVIVDYAIPREKLAEAKARDQKFNSSEAVGALFDQARNSFTDLATTGEGGEILLFLLAERFLKLPQILCKMDLKTDSRMHYHGADGVYAGIRDDGVLKLYWGESKIYSDASSAIRECLASLAPYLREPDDEGSERERDLVLLSDKADLGNSDVRNALRRYFDKSSPMSNRVQYCGIALVGFDASFYPASTVQAVVGEVEDAARVSIKTWRERVRDRIVVEKLDKWEIHFLCLPMPSAEGFRTNLLRALGLGT